MVGGLLLADRTGAMGGLLLRNPRWIAHPIKRLVRRYVRELVQAGRGLEPRPVEGGYLRGRGEPVVQPAVPHDLEGGCVYETHRLDGYGGYGRGVDAGARGASFSYHPPFVQLRMLWFG